MPSGWMPDARHDALMRDAMTRRETAATKKLLPPKPVKKTTDHGRHRPPRHDH